MSIRDTVTPAFDAKRPRKSPVHLFLLPVAFGIMGASCYGLVTVACAIAALLREDVHGFSSYGESAKSFIVLPLMLASIPIGFLVSNVLVWSILPLRRFFDREALSRPDGSFSASRRGLLTFSRYWIPPFLAIGFGAAFFGR